MIHIIKKIENFCKDIKNKLNNIIHYNKPPLVGVQVMQNFRQTHLLIKVTTRVRNKQKTSLKKFKKKKKILSSAVTLHSGSENINILNII